MKSYADTSTSDQADGVAVRLEIQHEPVTILPSSYN
jgi:hypothetical protein